jgi:hypothetical protein
MANNILTISMITAEALPVLENNLVLAKYVNREYDDQFAKTGAKIGASINVRLPSQFLGRSGAAISIEDDSEISVPLVITEQDGVDLELTSQELTLSMDKFKQRVLVPQMANVANKIDSKGCNLYWDIANKVGTPGTAPATLAALLAAGQRMNEELVPDDGQRMLMLDPRSNAALVGGLSTLFNKQSKLSEQYDSGNLTEVVGFNVAMDQNIFTHTVGVLGGTPAVSGANQGLTSGWSDTGTLVTNGWTAAAALRLKKGDTFTIANVLTVNRQSRRQTQQLREFVVTADTSSDASGNMTIPIAPAIITGGQYQNVNVSPANGALLTITTGTASQVCPQSIAFHKNAFCLASVDMLLPGGTDMAARKNYKGISMRLVRSYDVNQDRFVSRFDVLYGWRTLRREQACRVTG